jgi:hypothetical protein
MKTCEERGSVALFIADFREPPSANIFGVGVCGQW